MKGRRSQAHSVAFYTSMHSTLQKMGTGGTGAQEGQVNTATWCNASPNTGETKISNIPLTKKSKHICSVL